MKKYPTTIFSRLSLLKSDRAEIKKINYWLEKLFKQEKEKNRRAKIGSQVKINPVQQEADPSKGNGFDDAVRGHAEKVETDRHILEDMVVNSNRIITKISSVFPWDFFPTTICVEDTRITIIYRQFLSSQVYSVDIKDISNVLLENGIFFASIIIISKTFTQNDIRISTLWKDDAIFVRRLIEGLRMFAKHDIDTSAYEVKELIEKLKELSTTKIVV